MIAARLFGVVLAGVLMTGGSPVAAQPTTGKPQAGSTTRAVELVVQSGHTAEIRALEYARNGRFFATAGKDSTIRIWSPDSARLVSAHGDGRLRFWALDGRVLKTVQALDYPVKTLAVSPDGKTLAAAGVLGTRDEERVKNVADKLATTLWDLEGNPMGRFSSHSTASLRFTPDGTHLVSGGQHDNRVNVYTRAGQLVDTITVGSTWQRSPQRIALSPDGQSIVTADDDLDPPGLKIWNRAGGLERSLERFSGNLTNVAMAPDGTMFVTLAADRRVRIWSLAGRLLRSVSGHTDYPSALAYAPNGNYVASGGAEVIIWSRDGRSLATLNGFGNGANVLTFSSDSRFLFCGDGSGTVHVFDLKDRQARRIKAHDGR